MRISLCVRTIEAYNIQTQAITTVIDVNIFNYQEPVI